MTIRYSEYVAALAPLEAFDPAAFVGDDVVSQELCSFVLTLAVIFNDFKGVIVGHHALDSVEPPVPAHTPEVGMYSALRIGLLRLHAGIFRELFDLIEKSSVELSTDFFVRLERQLPRRTRELWGSLRQIATARRSDNADLRALVTVRNTVAFHYGRRAIFQGYARKFLEGSKEEPLVSRGSSMQGTHFYFGDAAIQSYLTAQGDENALMAILTGNSPVITAINVSLYEIVTSFVEARKYGWRRPDARS